MASAARSCGCWRSRRSSADSLGMCIHGLLVASAPTAPPALRLRPACPAHSLRSWRDRGLPYPGGETGVTVEVRSSSGPEEDLDGITGRSIGACRGDGAAQHPSASGPAFGTPVDAG